jgi:succinylglutamate desuccinylase
MSPSPPQAVRVQRRWVRGNLNRLSAGTFVLSRDDTVQFADELPIVVEAVQVSTQFVEPAETPATVNCLRHRPV